MSLRSLTYKYIRQKGWNYNVDMKTEQEKMTIINFAVHSSNVSHSFYNNILTCKLTQELHNIWRHQI